MVTPSVDEDMAQQEFFKHRYWEYQISTTLENNLVFANKAEEYAHPVAQQFYPYVNTTVTYHHLQKQKMGNNQMFHGQRDESAVAHSHKGTGLHSKISKPQA